MRWLVAIFAIALVTRGVTLWELSHVDPYFGTPIVDELTNTQDAIRIASGERMDRPFWKPPLYPFLLSLTMLADPPAANAVYDTLPSPWIPKGLQAVLDSVTALLLVLLGTRLASRRVGRVAGIIYALSFTPVYYTAQILDTTLFTFLCVAALLLFDKARENHDAVGWALGGVVLGLAAVTRAPALLFAPVAMLLPWLQTRRPTDAVADRATPERPSEPHAPGESGLEATESAESTPQRPSTRTVVTQMVAVGLGVGITILPVTLANWKFGGDTVLISSNGGINFYIGNRKGDEPGADGLTSVNAGPRWRAILQEVDQDLKPSERSREYYRLARAQLLEDPGHFLTRLGRKSAALFDAFEVPNNKNFVEERSRSWLYTLLPGRTGLVLALGMIGLLFVGSRLRHRWLLVGFVATQAAGIVLFFVAARYRVPILAVLTIPAAAYLAAALRERRSFPQLTVSLVVLALWLAFTHVDALDLGKRFDRYVVDPLALAHARDHLARQALVEAARVEQSDPDQTSRLTRTAVDHFDASRRLYRRALDLDPDYPEVHHNLALRALEAQNLDEAERLCRLALANSAEWFEEGWNTLGRILASRWNPESVAEAKKAFERAIAIDPTYSKAYANLGQVYEQLLETGFARMNYELARRYAPDNVLYVILEARVLGKIAQPGKGRTLIREWQAKGLEVPPQHRELFDDVLAALTDAERMQEEALRDPANTGAGPDELPPGQTPPGGG